MHLLIYNRMHKYLDANLSKSKSYRSVSKEAIKSVSRYIKEAIRNTVKCRRQ
jgi:hypothetical protein